MKALVFRQVGTPLRMETVADPTPTAGQIIIQVSRCGTCGSDLHWSDAPGALEEGAILGHEFSGTVVEAAAGFSAGERVTALPLFPCWRCEDCSSGHYMHCSSGKLVGRSAPGAYAEFVAVDAKTVQRLPAEVGFDEGALIEPLAVAHHAVNIAGSLAGRDVLILGAGPIGCAITLFALRSGVRRVFVSEPSQERRARAAALGAHVVIDPTDQEPLARCQAVMGRAPDVVIECVGLPSMIGKAIDYVAKRGRVIVVGVCITPDSILPRAALIKEVSLFFSGGYQVRDFEAVTDHIARGDLAPQPLITDRVAMRDFAPAFEALKAPTRQCKLLMVF